MFTKTRVPLLTVFLFGMLMVFLACSQTEQESQKYESASEKTETMEVAVWNKVCPVCGDDVDTSHETVTHDGKEYGFGCAACPEKFSDDPEKFVKNLSEDGAEFIGG